VSAPQSYPIHQVNQNPERRKSRLKAAALQYAGRGVPVFPCKPGGKEPLVSGGFKSATTDPRRIHMWWSRWPGANVAAPTGPESGILAVDVDDFGAGSLDSLISEHGGEWPETAATATGGGGTHYLFRYPSGETIRNSAGKLGPGLDVRGDGGYVILPPSATRSPYEWLDTRPLAWNPRSGSSTPSESRIWPRLRFQARGYPVRGAGPGPSTAPYPRGAAMTDSPAWPGASMTGGGLSLPSHGICST
jgi:hypothetical protein